jgi:proliferating cell nuclear antigen
MSDTTAPTDNSKYIFHLRTTKTDPIKNLSELLRDLLTEGNLECTPEGIRLMSVSANRTVLVHMKLLGSQFEEYYCRETINLGLNMEEYFKIVKLVEKNEIIRFFVTEDDKNTLAIQRYNKEEDIRNTKYIKLMDIPVDPMRIPQIQYESVILMNSTRFQKICKEIFNFSDKLEIISTNNILYLKAHRENVQQEICIKPTNSENGMQYEVCNNKDDVISGVFNLKYLVQFSKCANLCNNVKIHIRNDYPLLVECEVAKIGIIRICLAPEVEDI